MKTSHIFPLFLLVLFTSGCGMFNRKLSDSNRRAMRTDQRVVYSKPIQVLTNQERDICIKSVESVADMTSPKYFQWNAHWIPKAKKNLDRSGVKLYYPQDAKELEHLPPNFSILVPNDGNYYYKSAKHQYRMIFIPKGRRITKRQVWAQPFLRTGAVLLDIVTSPIQAVILFKRAKDTGWGWGG